MHGRYRLTVLWEVQTQSIHTYPQHCGRCRPTGPSATVLREIQIQSITGDSGSQYCGRFRNRVYSLGDTYPQHCERYRPRVLWEIHADPEYCWIEVHAHNIVGGISWSRPRVWVYWKLNIWIIVGGTNTAYCTVTISDPAHHGIVLDL